jgi:hypothetical protein
MSRIYFHSPSGDTELRGSERKNMGYITGNILQSSVGPIDDFNGESWLRRLLPLDHWVVKSASPLKDVVGLFMRSQSETDGFVYNGQTLPMFDLALNTALFSGSDPVKLLARLHAQCEIHCYVTGENRQWLGSIIRRGRVYNIMRADQGWEDVIDLLYSRNDEPVVCSYSVCEQFPNLGCITEGHSWRNDSDAYYEASDEERWEACWKYLYSTRSDLELRPDSWGRFYFGNGLSGFDL